MYRNLMVLLIKAGESACEPRSSQNVLYGLKTTRVRPELQGRIKELNYATTKAVLGSESIGVSGDTARSRSSQVYSSLLRFR